MSEGLVRASMRTTHRAAVWAVLSVCGWACVPDGSLTGNFYCVTDNDCLDGQTCDPGTGYCAGGPGSNDAGSQAPNEDAGPQDAGTTMTSTGQVCAPCNSAADCGGGGNLCIEFTGQSGHFCGVACNSDADCTAGNTCMSIPGHESQCLPTSERCSSSTTTPDAGSPPVDAGPAQCTTETWSNFAENFFSTNCGQCHSFTNYSTVQSDASEIESKISSGEMPENATLTSTQKAQILQWLMCGLPQ